MISHDLTHRSLGEADKISDFVPACEEEFKRNELENVEKGQGKLALTEENVETLLTCVFSRIFKDRKMMLLARERALFQIPDLLAIDAIGRFTIIEIKKEKAKANDIVSQVNEYLVQCAQRDYVEISRLFHNYYGNFQNFHTLYHAALLLNKSIEHKPGLGPFLREGYYPSQKKDSNKGGEEYFIKYAEAAENCIKDKFEGIDIRRSLTTTLKEIGGDLSCSNSELISTFRNRFLYQESAISDATLLKVFNRRWHQVYFAPSYWFQENLEGEKNKYLREITEMLCKMYLRDVEISFYEYRILHKQKPLPAWLLFWRETEKWLESGDKKDKAIQWKKAQTAFDIFTENMLREGYVLKKDPGKYETWRIVFPDNKDIIICWPDNRDPTKLGLGYICFEGPKQNVEYMIQLLKHDLQNVEVSSSKHSKKLQIRWKYVGESDMTIHAKVASEVVSIVLKVCGI